MRDIELCRVDVHVKGERMVVCVDAHVRRIERAFYRGHEKY